MNTFRYSPVSPLPAGYFPEFYSDLFLSDSNLQQLYANAGVKVNWDQIIQEKSSFTDTGRKKLVEVLRQQYANLEAGKAAENISKLLSSNTFTITTGQQIHTFLGPLFLLYKALSTISLANVLTSKYPDKQFVPVFWMATEDHDLAEIDHVSVFGKKYRWDTAQTGAVGRFSTAGLSQVLAEIKSAIRPDVASDQVFAIFETAYSRFQNLADATRYLLNHFLGDRGLVVLDADHSTLKESFRDVMKADLLLRNSESPMRESVQQLKHYGIEPQLPAKNGNFFLLSDQKRERIDVQENGFKVQGTERTISMGEMSEMIDKQPDMISPNAAFRPLYQETILPNIAYIAGPGEIKYWLQLTGVFRANQIPLPALFPRHSLSMPDEKSMQWLHQNGIDESTQWEPEIEWKNKLMGNLKETKGVESQVSALQADIEELNAKLYAQGNKDLKTLKKMGDEYLKELLRSQKRWQESLFEQPENKARIEKAMKIRARFFDPSKPQERIVDFLEALLKEPSFLDSFDQLPEIDTTHLFTVDYN